MRKSFSATIWTVFDRTWSQLVGFLIGIVLARLLTPEDYGLVGISMIFIAFSNVFIEAGFSNALIRKLDRSQTDYSTAFYFNAVMGIIMYLILYFAAPLIANYFEDEILIPLTRIVGLTLVINSLCIVQNAILTADLKMKEQAIINISAQIPSGLLAIYLAYRGMGVYALAVQTVLASFIRTCMFWIWAKWIPTWEFNKASMKYLWGFGSKLIGANFIGTLFNEIYTILIGKYISKSDLGLYSKGRSLSNQPESICNGVVQKVAVPLLSKYQNDVVSLKAKYRELTQVVNCIMLLVSGILLVAASPIILLLWGQKWVGSVPIFQMLLIASIVSYVSYLSLVLLQVINQTGYTLKLELIKKPICLLAILFSLRFGMYGLLGSLIFNSLFCSLINMSAASKYINYSYPEQGRDVVKYLLSLIVAVFTSFCIARLYETNYVVDIIVRATCMASVYVGMLWIMKDQVFLQYGSLAWKTVKSRIGNMEDNKDE